jgi:hypothetical protein
VDILFKTEKYYSINPDVLTDHRVDFLPNLFPSITVVGDQLPQVPDSQRIYLPTQDSLFSPP